MKRASDSTEDFKLRIAAIVHGKREQQITGTRRPHPLLVRKRKSRGRKTKRLALLAASALMSVGSVRALPLNYLIEEQRAKIEPAAKLFQKECGGQTGSEACKEQPSREIVERPSGTDPPITSVKFWFAPAPHVHS